MQPSQRILPNKKARLQLESMHSSSASLSILNNSSHSTSTMSREQASQKRKQRQFKIYDDPKVVRGYESVPLLEVDSLPRGGISLETKAVGRIQFGIPPETIKDSMLLGMEVPSVYIVPVERFCREMGPALGINMAEFEFPAYFNYFIRQKRCTLVVDSLDAEGGIRSVFEETLLGPGMFRNHSYPLANVAEDFDPSFPKDARPNFYKEFYNFRTAEKSSNYEELSVSELLEFVHFFPPSRRSEGEGGETLGVPPTPAEFEITRDVPTMIGRTASDVVPSLLDQPKRVRLQTDEDISTSKAPRIRPPLKRSYSDSSSSAATDNQSLHDTFRRRNSLGSMSRNSLGSMSSTDNPPRAPLVVKGRRSSMPMPSPMAASKVGFFEKDLPSNGRRDSIISINSAVTGISGLSSRFGRGGSIYFSNTSFSPEELLADDGEELQETSWMYSQAKWLGEVATVYPKDATQDDKNSKYTARVEIFKMAGGTEYIIHDIDENNIIIGKARISGTVRVPDEFSIEGFISKEGPYLDDDTDRNLDWEDEEALSLTRDIKVAPTFHPPSFGVTVLGNSHGFDKNGSTSGYVLWVNGRGIMVDPPPYSSATLEREGIRPQMIMAIIITHCHADHDAGAFQKVMTGSRVAIITTPTIYKSFIRKYSALSGLRQSLLRHSHRHRPAIIGQPLRFQGATFHFTYTLHTIPCISFKVEWRGKSIVFTGDHMNIPPSIDSLEKKGVLSKARADDLRNLPIQNCDVLLHEAGAPPIHTPLSVLEGLPDFVKDRLYVVHTSAIPPDSKLRVAPTGTEGTIRLDRAFKDLVRRGLVSRPSTEEAAGTPAVTPTISAESFADGKNRNMTVLGNYDASLPRALMTKFNGRNGHSKVAPLVFLRPTDASDAWFILNLLSAVPFLSSLSYAHTMEILEIAHVELYNAGEVVVEGARRPEVLCVFWEGTCVARRQESEPGFEPEAANTVWHAGDWTGPISLQPDVSRSAHNPNGETLGDIVALSGEGVKVIVLTMKDMLRILKAGSKLFRKYSTLPEHSDESSPRRQSLTGPHQSYANNPVQRAMKSSKSELLQIIEYNSVLGSLKARQKRHLESLAEGPRYFAPLTVLWQVGDPVDFAFLIVGGTATIGKKAANPHNRMGMGRMGRRGSTGTMTHSLAAIQESHNHGGSGGGGTPKSALEPILQVEGDKLLQNVHPNSEYARLEAGLQMRSEEMEESIADSLSASEPTKKKTVQAYRARFANKVLARLYARRAYTEHLVFSRGNLLSDTSRMVSGDLANLGRALDGENSMRGSMGTGASCHDHHCHTSNLIAGPQGCVVMVFPKSTLVPFLDNNPGVLLCLLGTQVVI